MRGNSRLRIAIGLFASLGAMSVLQARPAFSKSRKARPAPTATPAPTPIPTPVPEVKLWNFDQDKAGRVAQGWTAVEADWQVLADPTAPSQPNAFGLAAGREIKSLLNGLEYSAYAVVTDPAEYSDFTLEVSFKARRGWFDCSGGVIFRYADPRNYYLLSAGCPSDYFALYRISSTKTEVLKQTVVPVDQGVWYQLKVVADGEHLSCYSNDKLVFDVTDSKIRKGRIGLWAHDDSQALFDNVKLTLPASTSAPLPPPAGEAMPPLTPPPMPGAEPGTGAPPPMPR